MARDIDQIIELLRREIPGVEITQLQVTHPGADDDAPRLLRVVLSVLVAGEPEVGVPDIMPVIESKASPAGSAGDTE